LDIIEFSTFTDIYSMVVHIVIPVRDQLHLTKSIVEQLKEQPGWDRCWIFDNGSTDGTHEYLWDLVNTKQGGFTKFSFRDAPDLGIYEMWDQGFKLSQSTQTHADYVAFFNNDIELSHHLISHLVDALDTHPDAAITYPDYTSEVAHTPRYRVTKGTFRHGGMSGYCFMLRASAVTWSPLVDPQFKWWGGDDDIAFSLGAKGWHQVRVLGVPMRHLHEGTARHYDLGAQKVADLQAVIKKWGR
jgi:GT2 family glycosyltransferase